MDESMKKRMVFAFLILFLFLIVNLSSCDIGQKSCFEQDGIECAFNEECNDAYIDSSDSLRCCSGDCKLIDCNTLGGFICEEDEECSGETIDSSDGKCCFDSCIKTESSEKDIEKDIDDENKTVEKNQSIEKTKILTQPSSSCNVNSICEAWESDNCSDCQCSGTVCGGVCYAHEGTCCGNNFIIGDQVYCSINDIPEGSSCSIPGECLFYDTNVHVVFLMDFFLEVNKTYNGNILIINDNNRDITVTSHWAPSNIEIDNSTFNNIVVDAKSSKTISFNYKSNSIPDLLKGISYDSLYIYTENNGYKSPIFYSFEKADKETLCGGKVFPYQGVCINDVFFTGAKCSDNDLNKYDSWCANGMIIVKDDLDLGTLLYKFEAVGDIIPRGHKKVAVYSVGKPGAYDFDELQNYVKDFFSLQSIRITGKELLSFTFTDFGNINGNWNEYRTREDVFNATMNLLSIQKGDFDFVIAYMPEEGDYLLEGQAGGYYVGEGRVLIGNTLNDPTVVVHEIVHAFNAIDLYFMNSYVTACGTYLSDCIMCSVIITDQFGSTDDVKLCSGAFLRWGDLNNDGIIDLDNQISDFDNTPLWFNRIGIDQLGVRTVTNQSGKFAFLEFTVVDNRGNRVEADLTVTGNFPGKVESRAYDGFGSLNLDTSVSGNYILSVEFKGKKDTRSISYDVQGSSVQGDLVRK